MGIITGRLIPVGALRSYNIVDRDYLLALDQHGVSHRR